MTTIKAIKSKLRYSNLQEQEQAYASWFTVIAILADAYADEGMEKEETICRWIIRERKIPKIFRASYYWWWCMGDEVKTEFRLPIDGIESINLNLFN